MIVDAQSLLAAVIAAPDLETQQQLLADHQGLLDDLFADLLKQQSNHYLHADANRCVQFADLLLYQAQLTGSQVQEALGWLAKANYFIIGVADYQQGLAIFERIDELYDGLDLSVHKAKAQLSKVVALAHVGRYADALAVEQWAAPILEEHEEWRHLIGLIMNLATSLHGRRGNDLETLQLLDYTRDLCPKLGDEGHSYLAFVEENRAYYLCNLGRLEESVVAAQHAYELQAELGNTIEAARAQWNLGETLMLMGNYNRALTLFDLAHDVFVNDGRHQDALRIELDTTTCLLKLRRFQDVLLKCRQIRAYFSNEGIHIELGRAILNEAIAYAALHRYSDAVNSLQDAIHLFEKEEGRTWVTLATLELAVIAFHQANYAESHRIAKECATAFLETGHILQEAQAKLIAGRAAVAMAQVNEAAQLLNEALVVGKTEQVPTLIFQCYALKGQLAAQAGDLPKAQKDYEQAIRTLEELRGQLMVEFRVGFLEDKTAIYEEMVALCLQLEEPALGLTYVERAKSRALLDLLSHQLNLRIQPRDEADGHLVETLKALQSERDRLYQVSAVHLQNADDRRDASKTESFTPSEELAVVEQQIADLWHRLLIRNADYAGDAAFWAVRTEPIQPYLSADTILLEYFIIQDEVHLFVVTADTIMVHRLPTTRAMIQKLLRRFWLNLRMVPQSSLAQLEKLSQQAEKILAHFFQMLMGPISEQLATYPKLYIVPHGPLHYLPFHAFFQGSNYLMEQHEICYLPSGSMLHYLQKTDSQQDTTRKTRPNREKAAIFGYSNNNFLPQVVPEAQAIAGLLGGDLFVETAATQAQLQEIAPNCDILHLATHGDFRADNPLFSGITLADGTLTTLDIFDLSLKASLVTLSACQTGRNVVAGGDELLGLMRAFLAAGANSLLLSMWQVEDHATQKLMLNFYTHLKSGVSKSAALSTAQRQLRVDTEYNYSHPYFWAPFFMIGQFDMRL